MLRWLRPPAIDEEYDRVVYTSLHYTLLLSLIMTTYGVTLIKDPIDYIITPTIELVFIVSFILMHTGRPQQAGAVFLGGAWLTITSSIITLNGVHNAALQFYVVLIVFSNAIFTHRKSVIAFVLLCIASTMAVAIGDNAGALPLQTRDIPLTLRAGIAVTIFAVTGLVSSFASNSLRTNLARAKQNEERYRLLFENASIMAIVYDAQGKLLLVNGAAANVIGKTRVEMEGRTIDEVYDEEDAAMLKRTNQQVLESGKILTFEGSRTTASGGTMLYTRHVIPLPSEDGLQVMGLTTDFTEQKRNLERQQELQAAQAKADFYAQFFSAVSHDIKTPLTVMESGLYLLGRSKDEKSRVEKIAQLRQQLRVMDHFIQDMLMISRLEFIPSVELQSVQANALAASVIELLTPRFEEKNITCVLDEPEEIIQMKVDEFQMRRALTNLIENAVNYTPAGGTVSISFSQEGDTVTIAVTDTGIGVREEDIPHIFDAFYRAPEAKTAVAGGSGLGLAIVKRIAELHGGTITVESQPQQGARFIMTLPIT